MLKWLLNSSDALYVAQSDLRSSQPCFYIFFGLCEHSKSSSHLLLSFLARVKVAYLFCCSLVTFLDVILMVLFDFVIASRLFSAKQLNLFFNLIKKWFLISGTTNFHLSYLLLLGFFTVLHKRNRTVVITTLWSFPMSATPTRHFLVTRLIWC